jgi:uncharacterized membrane protein
MNFAIALIGVNGGIIAILAEQWQILIRHLNDSQEIAGFCCIKR